MIWIGVDPHKRVHQATALAADGTMVTKQVSNTVEGWAALLAWAEAWPEREWAIEGAGSLGYGLAQFLVGSGEAVRDVCPRWTAQRRRTQRRPGKNDTLDALAVARLLREEGPTLPEVRAETPEIAALQIQSRLREQIVLDMTRLRNRLHALLLAADPIYSAQLPSLRSAAAARACQRYVAPGTGALVRERERAIHFVAEQLVLLHEQEAALRRDLVRVARERLQPLVAIEGVGPLLAAALVAELGSPRPGLGEAQLAALAGIAPLHASSAGGVRHRLNRTGNRRLNSLVFIVSLTQQRIYPPAQAYLTRRCQEGRTPREARRALKRLLVRRLWHAWQACATAPCGAP